MPSVPKAELQPATRVAGTPRPESALRPAAQYSALGTSRISLASVQHVSSVPHRNVVDEVVSLNKESLSRLWKKFQTEIHEKASASAVDKRLAELLMGCLVEVVDEQTMAVVTANEHFEEAFAELRPRFEELMRGYASNPKLAVQVRFQKVDENLAYDPRAKFERMREINPAMDLLFESFDILSL